MKSFAAITSLLLTAGTVAAQQDTSVVLPPKELPSVHLGLGLTIFKGDVGQSGGVQTSLRPAFNLAVEQRLNNFAGIGIDGLYGKLSKNERSLTSNLNFESKAIQFGLHGIFYFDNDAIFKRNAQLAPYITAGVGYLLFDPHGDLKDAKDSTYYYWSDGSIRDQPDLPANQLTAHFLQRDYTYETQLKDSATNYKRSTLVVPLGLGFRFSAGHNFGGTIAATYNLCFTDHIDNVKAGGNDSYIYTAASIYYKFGSAKTVDTKRYADVDFAALDKADYDEDGVPDNRDDCPGTPKGVAVDNSGCPIDSDKDGVPDYRDKEPKSRKGYIVDENGVSLDYQQIASNASNDSIAAVRDSLFQANPSLETLNKIEQQQTASGSKTSGTSSASKLPEAYRPADKDNNGLISANEITKAIDDFFNGEGDWTVEKINHLIDYFFEQ